MSQASVLSPEEIAMIFQLYDREIVNHHRSNIIKHVFAFGVYSGLRVGEILSLTISDVYETDKQFNNIDFRTNQSIAVVKKTIVFRRTKKRDKIVYGEIPMHPKLRLMLYDYRKYLVQHYYHNLLGEPWLFPGRTQNKTLLENVKSYNAISLRAINTDFAKKGKLLSIPQLSSHSMRRTALTSMYRKGVDLKTLQFISGHENLKDLQLYLEIDSLSVLEAIEKMPY